MKRTLSYKSLHLALIPVASDVLLEEGQTDATPPGASPRIHETKGNHHITKIVNDSKVTVLQLTFLDKTFIGFLPRIK